MHSTQKKQHDNEKTKISIMYLLLKLMNFPQAMNVSFQAGTYSNEKMHAHFFLRYLSELANSFCVFFPHHDDPPWKNHQPSAEDFSKLLLPKDSGSRKATWNFPEFRPINIAWPLFWFLGLTPMVHLHLVSCSFSDIKYYNIWDELVSAMSRPNSTTPYPLTLSLPSVTKMQPSNNCLSLYRCTWIKLSLRKWSQSSPSTRAWASERNVGKRPCQEKYWQKVNRRNKSTTCQFFVCTF